MPYNSMPPCLVLTKFGITKCNCLKSLLRKVTHFVLASFLFSFLLLGSTALELTAHFRSVLLNPCHISHDLLPNLKVTSYKMLYRSHDLTSLESIPFIIPYCLNSVYCLYPLL